METIKTTGRMIGPLVGYNALPSTATLIDSNVTPRGTLQLWDGGFCRPGFAPAWFVSVAGTEFVGASDEATCRKVYDATK